MQLLRFFRSATTVWSAHAPEMLRNHDNVGTRNKRVAALQKVVSALRRGSRRMRLTEHSDAQFGRFVVLRPRPFWVVSGRRLAVAVRPANQPWGDPDRMKKGRHSRASGGPENAETDARV
jgi:hypothetical protein